MSHSIFELPITYYWTEQDLDIIFLKRNYIVYHLEINQ